MTAPAGAEFSACGRYRYRLWRQWGAGPRFVFLMLNPSTADEVFNDPTVERCQRRTMEMGGGSLEVLNIFAWRSTYPIELYRCEDPIGPENDAAILAQTADAHMIVCAWGTHGRLGGRGEQVRRTLASAGRTLHALRVNRDGTPAHPLYLPYRLQPERW